MKQILLFIFLPFLLFFSLYGQSIELETVSFTVCEQRRATGLQIRTIRIHKSPEQNNYLTIYSQQGKDKLIFKGSWLSFAQKASLKQKESLIKSGWECKKEQASSTFYTDI